MEGKLAIFWRQFIHALTNMFWDLYGLFAPDAQTRAQGQRTVGTVLSTEMMRGAGSQSGDTIYSYHVTYEFEVGERVHTQMNNVDSYGRLQKGDRITVYYLSGFFPPQSAIDRDPRELSGPLREMLDAVPNQLQEPGVRTEGMVLDVITKGTGLGPVYGVEFRFWDDEEKPWKNVVWLTEKPRLTVGSTAPVVYLRERPRESTLALASRVSKADVPESSLGADVSAKPNLPLDEQESAGPEFAPAEPTLEPVPALTDELFPEPALEPVAEIPKEAFPAAGSDQISMLPDDLFLELVPEPPLVESNETPVVAETPTVSAGSRPDRSARESSTPINRVDSEAEALVTQGISLLDERKAREASECFTKAIALDPGNREAWERRADAYDRMGRRASASGDRRRAAAIE